MELSTTPPGGEGVSAISFKAVLVVNLISTFWLDQLVLCPITDGALLCSSLLAAKFACR